MCFSFPSLVFSEANVLSRVLSVDGQFKNLQFLFLLKALCLGCCYVGRTKASQWDRVINNQAKLEVNRACCCRYVLWINTGKQTNRAAISGHDGMWFAKHFMFHTSASKAEKWSKPSSSSVTQSPLTPMLKCPNSSDKHEYFIRMLLTLNKQVISLVLFFLWSN